VSEVSTSTFPALLADLLRTDASRPLVTFYDDATGERIELSRATYANWVSKTAGLVQDELEVERGALVLVDLPTHWLGTVWLGAAWTAGISVTADRSLAGAADLVVCAPGGLDRYAVLAGDRPVVAVSLRPLGGRFVAPLPSGVIDYGAVVLALPDVFVPADPPTSHDPAWREGAASMTQAELLDTTAGHQLVEPGGRLLTDVNPCLRAGVATLLSPLLQEGATVWVANAEESTWQRKYDEERATAQLLTADQGGDQPPRS
jgi:uncharacterized protein (TIGR03089 family)